MSLPVGQVLQGDCLDILRGWPDKCVECIITDIPYAEVNRASAGIRVLTKGNADVIGGDHDPAVIATRLCELTSGSVYVFCGLEQISPVRAAMVKAGLSTRLCVWHKTNPSPMNGEYLWLSSLEACVFGRKKHATFNEHCASSVWEHPSGDSKIHPTQKPDGLMQRLVRASTNEGDTILDPFCGSGSTLAAAERLGRKWIGIDIDPHWCEVARRRTAQKGLDFTQGDAA